MLITALQRILNGLLASKQSELTAGNYSAQRMAQLKKEIAELEANSERNRKNMLWRHRNQLAFSIKTYIPEDEFAEIVFEWKEESKKEAV